MKCPACVKAGQQSTLTHRYTTGMFTHSYYDEDGVYHFHDPNRHFGIYECSGGHRVGISRLEPCPAEDCAYGKSDPEIKLLTAE